MYCVENIISVGYLRWETCMSEKKDSNKICIVLKALDHRLLDAAVDDVVRIAKQERVVFKGPIPLPTDRLIITVNRSCHIDKESRDQFQKKTHKRLFYVNANPRFIEALSRHSLAAGVEAKIRLKGV